MAYEAFVRFHKGGRKELPPDDIFSADNSDDDIIELDRLCRLIHTLNLANAEIKRPLLFLNVHAHIFASGAERHGCTFRSILDEIGFPSIRVVIEAPLVASQQPELLAFVLRNFRDNGFGIAVNVASFIQSQKISRLIQPDFVKISADHLGGHIGESATRTRWLKAIAEGTNVVITRVEERPKGELPIDALLQGYAFGAPAPLQSAACGPISA